MNHKKIQRLWRDEGLRVRQQRRRKRVGSSTVDPATADAPNVVRVDISRSRASCTKRSLSVSSAEVASSRMRISGFFKMALAIAVLAPLASAVIQMAISRTREYDADEDGAAMYSI